MQLQQSESASGLSFEALCQAAKSELQNISKENQQQTAGIVSSGSAQSDASQIVQTSWSDATATKQYTTLMPASTVRGKHAVKSTK